MLSALFTNREKPNILNIQEPSSTLKTKNQEEQRQQNCNENILSNDKQS